MRDARRIQERVEIRMDRIQAVWLALGVATALGLMFALGVVVGRRAARIEPKPPAADPLAEIKENESVLHGLYETLTDPPRGSAPERRPAAERRDPVEPTVITPSRAQSANARPRPAARKPEASSPSATSSRAASNAARPAPGDAAEVRRGLGAGPPRPGEYTLQVSAFETEAEAEAFAAALVRKGFSPFVRRADLPGKGTWYRVRMGRFASEQVARKAKGLLSRSDIPAWVLRLD